MALLPQHRIHRFPDSHPHRFDCLSQFLIKERGDGITIHTESCLYWDVHAFYYVFAIIKSYTVDFRLLFNGEIAGLSEYFLVMTVVEIGIGVIVLAQSLYLSLANYFSGKANTPIDLRLNFAYSKKFLMRHNANFFISLFVNVIVLLLATMSSLTAPEAYTTLAILYAFVLVVPISGFAVHQSIMKRVSKPDLAFKKENRFVVFAALFLVAYVGLYIAFGQLSFEKMGGLSRTAFMTF